MKNEESVEIISKFIKSDLRKYIELLVNDKNFVVDIEKSKIFNEFKDLSPKEKMNKVDSNLGNTARTYILNIIVLKHLYRLSIEMEDLFLDLYWKDKIKDI